MGEWDAGVGRADSLIAVNGMRLRVLPHDGAMRLLATGARPAAQQGVPTVTQQLYLRLAEVRLLVMTRLERVEVP